MKRRPKGTGSIEHGYCIIERDGVRKRAHVWIVEAVLGKELPKGAVPHHVNGDKLDNRHENLVLCPSQAYHMLLHQRERALDACGHADWLRCHFCKAYDDPRNLSHGKRTGRPAGQQSTYHAACANASVKSRYYRFHEDTLAKIRLRRNGSN
jgi:hypothetical protein